MPNLLREISLSLLLLAAPAPIETVVVDATIDRIEEDRLVLDLPPHPSLPVPRELGPELAEGAAVTLEIHRELIFSDEDTPPALGFLVLEVGSTLRLEQRQQQGTGFWWPAELAPPVAAGERLWMRLRDDPVRAARLRREIEAMRSDLLDP